MMILTFHERLFTSGFFESYCGAIRYHKRSFDNHTPHTMKTYAAAQVVLALAIAATVANAATIKVDPTSPDGSDTAGCGSSANNPCKSIGFAYNQAVAGDLIHLHPTTYSSAEDKMISTAGLSPPKWDKSGLTIETDPWLAGKAVVDLGGNNMFAAFDSVTSVKIKNIDIKNGGSDGNGAGG